MSTLPQTIVVGVFTDQTAAQQAVNELRRVGFSEDQIGVVVRENQTVVTEPAVPVSETAAEEGAVAGGLAGAGIGGLWAVGIAVGLLPAIGPVLAGGLLISLLASAATGAVAGGVLGALIGLGIPEDEAQFYEREFRSGRTIVTVRPQQRYDEVVDILHRYGAYNVNPDARPESWAD